METENLGSKLYGALVVLRQFSLHSCGHEKQPISGTKCLLSMVANCNEKHYIVATQDRDLQSRLRKSPGVPLMYLHSKAPVLDPPSQISINFSRKLLNNRYGISPGEESIVQHLTSDTNSTELKVQKKRKRKEPNPLSCKKKKRVCKKDTVG